MLKLYLETVPQESSSEDVDSDESENSSELSSSVSDRTTFTNSKSNTSSNLRVIYNAVSTNKVLPITRFMGAESKPAK